MGKTRTKIRTRFTGKTQVEPRVKVACPDHDSYVMFMMCLRQCEELPVSDPWEYERCVDACKSDFGCEMDLIEVVVHD